jgi:hypothetical protein
VWRRETLQLQGNGARRQLHREWRARSVQRHLKFHHFAGANIGELDVAFTDPRLCFVEDIEREFGA